MKCCIPRRRTIVVLSILGAGLAVSMLAGMLIGSVDIGLQELLSALWHADPSSAEYRIVIYVRLPRVLSAVMAGGALACAGALLQCMLGNRLASPGIIGVNAGSGLFSLLAILMFPASTAMAAWGAFIGALVAMVLVFVISGTGGISTPGRVILTGVAVSSLFTALLDTVVVLRPDLQMDRLAFSLGGFAGADMPSLLSALPFFCIGLVGSLVFGYDWNLLVLGDEMAMGLGMRVPRIRFFGMLFAAMLAGSAVSLCGLLGFVGLIAPHMAAGLLGTRDMRSLLPGSLLFGAMLTVVCELLARSMFSPYEIPVGIVLSYIGVPFFLFLLYRRGIRAGGE